MFGIARERRGGGGRHGACNRGGIGLNQRYREARCGEKLALLACRKCPVFGAFQGSPRRCGVRSRQRIIAGVSSTPLEAASREKRAAALASIGSAVVLLSLKTFLAVHTGSLGVLSETLHSFLDLLAAILTFYSVREADKPADARHLYGHGKIESLSAFVETALLLLTAIYIIYEAITRLITGHLEMRPSLTAILILLGCMFV